MKPAVTHQLDLPFDGDGSTALLTPRDIWNRLNEGNISAYSEDRRVERKSWRGIHFDNLAEYLSCYSNTVDGGVVLIGVENDGKISGCSSISQKQLNKIESFHRTNCPMAQPLFRRIPILAKTDFVIAIFVPYIGRLVETNKGDAFIRHGESKCRMSDDEKRDFRATRQERSFEQEIANAQYPGDFDQETIGVLCSSIREAESERYGSWSNEEILADRNLGEIKDGAFCPANALVLLAGIRPGRIIPGCRIRIQRFSGVAEGEGHTYAPIRDRYVEGNIVRLIAEAKPVIANLNYDVTWLSADGKFITTPEYPENAWLEAITNACVHRSYNFSGSEITVKFFQDRLEVESPGGFIPPVNEANIQHTRAARNPHLMDALRYLGYVKMAREGVRRIIRSMKELDLPEPTFKQEAVHGVAVRVTLRNDHETRKRSSDRDVAVFFGVDVWKKLNEHEIKILAYAFRNKQIQVSEAQRITGRTWATSKKDLDRLVAKGLLQFNAGRFVRDPKATYELIERKNGDVE